jgi:hypothetical protein
LIVIGTRWLHQHRLLRRFLLDQHLAFELRQMLHHRIVDAQLALVLQHHHRQRRDRLRHRGDPKQAVLRHRRLRFEILKADGFLAHDFAIMPQQRHRSRERSVLHQRLHALADGFHLRLKAQGQGQKQAGGEAEHFHGGAQCTIRTSGVCQCLASFARCATITPR